MYFAVIGDMIGSRTLSDRQSAQNCLKEALKEVNRFYADSQASLFTITLGDEFQGLLNSADELMEIVDEIRFRVYPLKLRFGIGVGSMSTEILHDVSMGSDGPAYWAAREAIEYVHDNNDYGYSDICTRLYFDSESRDGIEEQMIGTVNSTLSLCGRMEKSWTQSQYAFVREVVLKYRYGTAGEYYQKEIADELGISPQMVSSRMKNTGLTTYISARQNIGKMLQKQWGEQNK